MMLGQAGDLVAGRYRLHRTAGGAADSGQWRAFDERLARAVTIRLALAADETGTGRAESARAVLNRIAQLNHPGVAAVYDAGVTEQFGGIPVSYAVSEWTDGRTLGQIMATGPQKWQRAADWGRQISAGLAALHAIGIPHGALGPDCVAVHDDRQVKILDAGFTSAAVVPPESAPPPDPDAHSLPPGAPEDVYALGLLLWQAMAAAPPALVDGEAPDPQPLQAAGVPGDFTALLVNLLAADREERLTAAVAESRFEQLTVPDRVGDSVPVPPLVSHTREFRPRPTAPTHPRPSTHPTTPTHPTQAARPVGQAGVPGSAAADRRRTGIYIGIASLLATGGVIVGLLLASAVGQSSATTPSGSGSSSPSSTDSGSQIPAVVLPSIASTAPTQEQTSAPVRSQTPTSASASPTPTYSPTASATPKSSSSVSAAATSSSPSPIPTSSKTTSPGSTPRGSGSASGSPIG
jgi:serine/threonine protein kinase